MYGFSIKFVFLCETFIIHEIFIIFGIFICMFWCIFLYGLYFLWLSPHSIVIHSNSWIHGMYIVTNLRGSISRENFIVLKIHYTTVNHNTSRIRTQVQLLLVLEYNSKITLRKSQPASTHPICLPSSTQLLITVSNSITHVRTLQVL
jgi:hypothetical protein